MVIVTPCINLNGQCEEAMTLYEKAFGATTRFMMRYEDADKQDWDKPLTDDQKNMIYHAEMFIGDQRLMFADIIEFDLSKGTSLFLTITFENAENVKKAYEVLKEGSTIVYPMISTTYSSCFVSLIDKFGVRWALMTGQTEM
ncbi:MAG: VOC family protein [Desulfobacteraceae bacterium]|jgi:PhnB protein